ncbi:MAG: DUF3015 domain-containing protein [Bacteriovoracaceae bacterium]|nr:DUF3015 domain-containing protein [Bacteriovoracaceae bacterium]
MKWILIALVFSLSAFAQDRSSGCGMGWQVTRSMTTSGSYTRALTNFTFSNTLAMTLGTSGRSKHDLVMKEREKIYYVEANLIPLKREVAMGQGERLNALATVWGCESQTLGSALKSNYRQLFKNKSAEQVVKQIDSLILVMPELKAHCNTQV